MLDLDLITTDRSFFIKGNSNFKSSLGSIFTLFFILCAFLIFHFMGGFFGSSVAASVEFELSLSDLKTIEIPMMKIIYGFKKSLYPNLKVVKQTEGVLETLKLQEYTDYMWEEHFNISKNPEYIYMFHYWQNTSIIRVMEKIPSKPVLYKPTDFYGRDVTNHSCLVRLNEFKDVECFSIDAISCKCELLTKDAMKKLMDAQMKNLDPLSCGAQHLKLWAMDGYSSPSHWCNIQRKLLLKLNPELTFDEFDETLKGREIFLAVEQIKFNDQTNILEKTSQILSDIDNPINFVIELKRFTSRVKINHGFISMGIEYLQSNYSTYRTKLVRKMQSEILLRLNIVDSLENIIVTKSKEISFELVLDQIAKIVTIIINVWYLLYHLHNFFTEYLLTKYFAQKYRSKINTKSEKSDEIHEIGGKNMCDYTLWNFLRYKLFSYLKTENKSYKSFENQYLEIKKLLSIENSITKNFEIQNYNNIFYQIIYQLDFLSQRRSYYINKNLRFQTRFGRILTIFYLLCIVILLYFIGADFFEGTQHRKEIFTKNARYDQKIRDIYQETQFLVYFSSWADPNVKFFYNNKTSGTLNYTNFPNNMIPRKCLDNEITNFNISKNNDLIYYCFDMMSLIDPYNDDTDEIKFALGRCHVLNNVLNLDLSGCNTTNPEPENIRTIEFGIIVKAFQGNEDGAKDNYKKDKITTTAIKKLPYNNLENITNIRNDISNVEWKEDSNPILNTYVAEHFNVISSTAINFQIDSSGNPYYGGMLSIFSFNFDRTTKYVKRIYPKFLILLNKVILISFLMKFFFKFLSSFCDDYFFLKNFSDKFFMYGNFKKMIIELKQKRLISKDFSSEDTKNYLKNDILCLKNHLYNVFPYKSKEVKIYKILKEELIISLTFEKHFFNTKHVRATKINIFEKIDLISDIKINLVNSNQNFKTIFGGILSIIFLILIAVFINISGENFFGKNDSSVSFTQLYPAERDLTYWENSKGPLMVYTTNVKDYPSSFVVLDHIKETIFEISNQSCTDAHFKELKMIKNDNFKYGCLNLSELLPKINDVVKLNQRFISVSVTSCKEWKTYRQMDHSGDFSSFATHPCPNKTIKTNDNITVGIKTKFKFFDQNDPNIYEDIIDINNNNNNGDIYVLTHYLWENQLEEDVGIFASSIQNSFFTSVVSKFSENYPGFNNGLFGRFFMTFYQSQKYYTLIERRYTKFNDFLVNLITVFNLLLILLQNIALFVNNYYFLKYFYNFFINDKMTGSMANSIKTDFKKSPFAFRKYFSSKIFFWRKENNILKSTMKDLLLFLSIERVYKFTLENEKYLKLQEG